MKRRGFSLIEVVVVMVSLTVIMGAAGCMLAALIRATDGGREDQQRAESLDRLAERFRRDAHAAVEIAKSEATDDPANISGFRLGPDHIVLYKIDQSGFVTRDERDGDRRSEDVYAIPRNCTGRITIDEKDEQKLVQLKIMSKDEPRSMLGEIRIEAVIGHDHRFATEAEERKPDEEKEEQ